MNWDAFLERFDREGQVVLLIGKRKVLEEDTALLEAFSKQLAARTKWMRFRSGNAAGADSLLMQGVHAAIPERMELVVPYRTHRRAAFPEAARVGLDDLPLDLNHPLVQTTLSLYQHPSLITSFLAGTHRFAAKGGYLLRDTLMVVGDGATPLAPASAALVYDDLEQPASGGTGFTLAVCRKYGIPVWDQSVWGTWVQVRDSAIWPQ